MALENPLIKAEVVEAQEFPYLAQSFRVSAVPKTVINKVVEVLGAVPEAVMLQKVLTAAGREDLLKELEAPPETSGPVTRL
jgi:hypothetical protein